MVPACNPGIPNVQARRYYRLADNALLQSWEASTLFLNPPYGKYIKKWTDKLIATYRQGLIDEALLLVPSKDETKWGISLLDYPMCHVRGRQWFKTPYHIDKHGIHQPKMQQLGCTIIVYFGPDVAHFANIFSQLGKITMPYGLIS